MISFIIIIGIVLLLIILWCTLGCETYTPIHTSYIVGWGPLSTVFKKSDHKLPSSTKMQIITSKDPTYDILRTPYNTQIEAPRPFFIAYPNNTFDVQKIVLMALKNNQKITARSGGHSYTGQSVSDGIIIDFWNMRKASINNNNTAWIEPGIRNFELDVALNKQNYVFPTGTCPDVGIGGYLLGGGIGFLGRKYGMACESILDAEIVLSDGSIIHASDDEDLLWAIKGSGHCNFGLITKFLVKIYKTPKVNITWNLSWTSAQTPQVIKTWQSLAFSLTEDISMNLALDSGGGVRSVGQYSGDTQPNLNQLLKPLLSIGNQPLKPTVYTNYLDVSLMFSGEKTAKDALNKCYTHNGASFSHLSDYAPPDGFSDEGIATILSFYTTNKKTAGGYASSAFDLMGGAITRGTGSFVHTDKSFQIQHMNYLDGKTDMDAMKWQIQMYNGIKKYTSGQTYQNYPSLLLYNPLVSYYGKNLERLIGVRNKYDPDEVFYQNQKIPSKLPYNTRTDGKCGTTYPTFSKNPSICDPLGKMPCCSNGMCTSTEYCNNGIDYSKRWIK